MFYTTDGKAPGLPHDPFKAIVAPRPIGWISTRARDGRVNLAPYSFFMAISSNPHLVLFSSEGEKDSVAFARESGEFAVNLATRDLLEAMNASSVNAPRGINEFELAGIETAECRMIGAPRVAASPAVLECKVTDILEPKALDGSPAGVIVPIGQVVGIHIDDDCIIDGLFDIVKAGTISRLGYMDYAQVTETFALARPVWKG